MSKSGASGTYFSVLDGIRGVAAILILIRHTTIFFGVKYQESFLAVDLFFVLSGVVIANAYEQRLLGGLGKRRFAWLRIVRIYPLYIAGTLLGLAGILAGRPFEGNLPSAIALSLVLLPYLTYVSPFPLNGVSWSLFYEIVANFIYAAFVRFLTNRVILAIICISALGLVTIAFQARGLDVGWEQQTFLSAFLRVGYSFFTGILLYRQFSKNNVEITNGGYGTLLSLAIVTLVAALLMAAPSDAMRPFYELATVLIVFPVIVYVAMALEPAAKISAGYKFLGLVSYGIYALHSPTSALVRGLMLKFAGVSNAVTYPSAPWFGFGFILAMALLCWLADKFYDAPMRRFMLRLAGQAKPSVKSSHVPVPTDGVEADTPANQMS
jgi:peptidoglycan/LPS O-acetylase OafA/YrhL